MTQNHWEKLYSKAANEEEFKKVQAEAAKYKRI